MGAMANRDSRIGWLQFANMNWLGATIKASLIKEFKTPVRALQATKNDLARIQGWDFSRIDRFINKAALTEPVCPPELLDRKNIRLVNYFDDDYPPLLREIPDSPTSLFVRGDLQKQCDQPCIAIVGARRASQLGYDMARSFGHDLAQAGFTVVSGMALGIDTHAHTGALNAKGATVAVLGTGPDVVYPRTNRRLSERISTDGALISEYAPGVIARPWHFPVRNRIISGMCLGTIVIEASSRSGSLITARLSAEQNREVFALPGSTASEFCEGTLSLLKEGATLVTDPGEIIEYFSELLPERAKTDKPALPSDLSDDEVRLLSSIANEPVCIDNLMENGAWKRETLFSLLLRLEMRDYLIKLPGNCYQARIKISAQK